MTLADLAPWQTTILWVINLIGFLFILWMNSKFVTRKEHDAVTKGMSDRIENQEGKITNIESIIQHLPTSQEVKDLTIQLVRVEEGMKNINPRFEKVEELMDRIQTQTDRIEDWLRKI